MFKQIIIISVLMLICLCSASGEIVYKARFANHSVCIDDSIYANHGVYHNITFESGVRNGAAKFNIDNSSITIPSSSAFSFTDGITDYPFTVAFWVNIENPSEHSPVLTKGNYPVNAEYVVTTMGDNPHGGIILNDAQTGYTLTCYSEHCLCEYNLTNGWMHACITYDGSGSQLGINMYFNGLPIEVVRTGHPSYTCMRDYNGDLLLGIEKYQGFDQRVNGRLDEVIIYDQELSEAQVFYLHESYLFNEYSITLIDEDLISIDKNISVYKNDEYVKTIVYGESINISNVFEYSFVLHEDNFDRFSHIENIGDTSKDGITYLVYAFVLIGIIALLMFMYRRF